MINETQPVSSPEFFDPLIDIKDAIISGDAKEINLPKPWPSPLREVALAGVAGDVVKAFTFESEADPVAILVSFVLAFSSACGPRAYAMVGAKPHFARFYAVLCGATGRARKGTSWAPVEELFKQIIKEAERLKHPLDDWCFDFAFVGSGEGLINLVRDEVKGPDGNIILTAADTKNRLVVDEEFASTLGAGKREGSTASQTLRRLYDSGTYRPIVKNSSIRTTNSHLSILGHITVNELGLALSANDVSNGLANRFLWFSVRRQAPQALPATIDENVLKPLALKVLSALQVAQDPGELKRSSSFNELWRKVYPALTEDKYEGRLQDIVGRAEAAVFRLTMLYCLLDGKRTLQPDHLESALALWKYSEDSCRYLFGEGQESEAEDSLSFQIAQFLSTGPKSQTELTNSFSAKHGGEGLRKTLKHLESVGRISRHETGGGKSKGRPKTTWVLRGGPSKIEQIDELINQSTSRDSN